MKHASDVDDGRFGKDKRWWDRLKGLPAEKRLRTLFDLMVEIEVSGGDERGSYVVSLRGQLTITIPNPAQWVGLLIDKIQSIVEGSLTDFPDDDEP